MPSTLPLVANFNEEASSALPQPARPKLLIVDDEEGPRMSLRVVFGDEFDILMAEDGPSAIEIAKNHRIDVAVLDIRMPDMPSLSRYWGRDDDGV